MTTYIYFVKCPGCEDEHFDFFDDAKGYAMSCLSQKPVITQTEVNRNDFGECTDSCDLGTVWSWEDMMKDTEPDDMVFSKDETFGISEGLDDFDDFDIGPQIDELSSFEDDLTQVEDNNLWVARVDPIDSVKATDRMLISLIQDNIKGPLADKAGSSGFYSENGQRFMAIPVSANSDSYDFDSYKKELQQVFPNTDIYCVVDDSEIVIDVTSFYAERKPIPDGMTIEQLVEEMEENEDTVECVGCEELFAKDECFHKDGIGWLCGDCEDRIVKCTWCEELFDKSECRREVDLGWLCDRCEMGIKSRGETLTFREGNYWDFLDESTDAINEATELIEAKYDFTNLQLGDDKLTADELAAAKEDIKDALITRDRNYYVDNKLAMSVLYSANDKIRITDFTFDHGRIKLLVTRTNIPWNSGGDRVPVDTYLEWDLKDATAEVKDIRDRNNLKANAVARPLQFIKDLTEIATEVNKNKNLGVAERRNRRVANIVNGLDDKIAEELRSQIKQIKFSIPAAGYRAADIADLDAIVVANKGGEPASKDKCKRAAEHLSNLRDSFFALNLQNVDYEDRYASEVSGERAAWFISSWGNEAVITFKCSIGELSEAAQNLIKETKFIKNAAEPEAEEEPADEEARAKKQKEQEDKEKAALRAKSTNNYRLAVALCQYFGNDAKFYEKTTTESLETNSRFAFCPECGVDEVFDHKAGLCTSCGYKH